jgi:hypothetical protein
MSTSMNGKPMEPRLFTMIRYHDERGVSGTGGVFDGVVFHTGNVVIGWRTDEKHGYTRIGVSDTGEAFTFVHMDSHPTNETAMQWLSPRPRTYNVHIQSGIHIVPLPAQIVP